MKLVSMILALLGLWWPSGPLWAQFTEASCRSINLNGKFEPPPEGRVKLPLELTMTYQMNYQQAPALLVVNYPLKGTDFVIRLTAAPPFPSNRELILKLAKEVHAETRSAVDEATTELSFYAPPMFIYPREIVFRHYFKSADGKRVSDLVETAYFHDKKMINDESQCESTLTLAPAKFPG